MTSVLSLDDLFLAGIVFDITGAYLLVSGLLLSGEMIFRLGSTWEGLERLSGEDRCRNRARGEFGFGLLALGFLLQAAGYCAEVAGSPTESSGGRTLVAGLFMLIAFETSTLVWLRLGRARERHLLEGFAERQAEQKQRAETELAEGQTGGSA